MGYEWKNQYLVGGFNPSEKYYIVSWGYYSKYMGKKHAPNHQPDMIFTNHKVGPPFDSGVLEKTSRKNMLGLGRYIELVS